MMNREPLGEMLLKKGLLSEDALKRGVEEKTRTGRKLGEALVSLGYISGDEMLEVLGSQMGVPVVMSGQYPGAPARLDAGVKAAFLREYKVVPVGEADGVLKLACAYPQDPYPADALRAATGLEVDVSLGYEADILEAVEAYYGDGTATVENIVKGIADGEGSLAETEDVEQLKDMALEAPVINLVNVVLTRALERRASDIHIEPFEESLHIRYRIDGILYNVETLPRRLHPAIASRIKIISKLNIAERRLPQDGRFKFRGSGREIDIRVSTIPTLFGESVVLRLLDPSGVLSLEAVGFSKENMGRFASLIRQPHGMVLVTGPTGSGKSTTLYSALSGIDTVGKMVVTIEDPVEYNLEGVNQIQVKPRIGLTFANGLRSIVRQDPDIIMVGEIRDAETAEIAIHSALTGHLIFSTLHTNDAPGSVTRLMDMGVESYLISSSLIGVLAQRLVRVICRNCREPYAPDPEKTRGISAELETAARAKGMKRPELYRGAGCDECGNTGYRGRTGIFELMTISDPLRQLIADKQSSGALRLKAVEEGMVTLREDGLSKALEGVTTIEEVSRVTLEKQQG